MEIREAARSVAKDLGYPNLKPERLEVVETFVKGRDVFAVLPTGYGKSLCFGCLPINCQVEEERTAQSYNYSGSNSSNSDHEGPGEWHCASLLVLQIVPHSALTWSFVIAVRGGTTTTIELSSPPLPSRQPKQRLFP